MISFNCEVGKLESTFVVNEHGRKQEDIFPILERIVNDVKSTVNSSDKHSGVKMSFVIDEQVFSAEIPYEGDDRMFADFLCDSFYGVAATIMDRLGIEGYEFPQSFENAIYSK